MKQPPGRPARIFSAGELGRMKRLIEAGEMSLDAIGVRFRSSRRVVQEIAVKEGWRIPYLERAKAQVKAAGERKTKAAIWSKIRATRARKVQEAAATFDERMATFGCRRLVGAEFAARAAELMAQDAAARAKVR